MLYFKDILFGSATAELEGALYPDLLLDGFLDPWDVIDKIIDSPKFLFLGYKGSGKSSIGEHLRLLSKKKFNLFVSNLFLSDFPYGNFEKIVTGDAEPESRYPSAWSWLLILSILNSLSRDESIYSDSNVMSSINALSEVGLLPTKNLKETVIASSKPKYKAKLPGLLDIEYDSNQKKINDLGFIRIISSLKESLLSFDKFDNNHIIIIDGLDDILLQKEIQYQSIAALILESTRLNISFIEKDIPIKIVVLCRTELYERIPGPNKNKIRQDLSVELDWYHNPRKPSSSKLVHLVNKRAQLKDSSVKDLLS
ncbi:MAG: P-loop ATPase, Sll1717 family [Candidatus Electrothrix sp. YB6]